MKKKMFSLLILICIGVIGLTACKKSVGTPEDTAVKEEEDESSEEVEKYMIGYSPISMENPYFITLESAIEEDMDKETCMLVTKDPSTDAELQCEQIYEMINEGIDAIILTPVDWEKITPALEALKEADVKIINVDAQVKEMDYVDAYIGSDNKRAGEICGEALIEKCPNGGEIAIMECPTQNSMNDRIAGFEEALSKAEAGFEVVARADTQGQFEQGLEAANTILEDHPDIVAMMCGNDQIAVAATAQINVKGLNNIIVFSVDGSPDIKKELEKTDTPVAGTAAQSPITIGKTALDIALKAMAGEEFEKEIFVDVFMIDKGNVEMYGADGWQ